LTVSINGEPRTVPDGLTVGELLDWLGVTRQAVAVMLDRQIVPKEAFSTRQLDPEAAVEIIRFVGGG